MCSTISCFVFWFRGGIWHKNYTLCEVHPKPKPASFFLSFRNWQYLNFTYQTNNNLHFVTKPIIFTALNIDIWSTVLQKGQFTFTCLKCTQYIWKFSLTKILYVRLTCRWDIMFHYKESTLLTNCYLTKEQHTWNSRSTIYNLLCKFYIKHFYLFF